MCVIVVADKRRPSIDELDKMEKTNPEGIGAAWREKDVVRWEKGINLDALKVLNEKLPMPYVIHFRVASCGGVLSSLTHPFPIERDMREDLSGTTKGPVLFHNGHWALYKDKGLDGAIRNKVKVPAGKWSDTRVMAWLAYLHGSGILELIDEKVILLSPTKIEIFHPEGWSRVNDLLVSNRLWENAYLRHQHADDSNWDGYYGGKGTVCKWGNCNKPSAGASWYCTDHQPTCRETNCMRVRSAGSEFCLAHQPICIAVMCSKHREPGEKYCLEHLQEKVESGGTPDPIPFRNGSAVAEQKVDHKGTVQNAEKSLAILDKGVSEAVIACLNDPELQGQSRWACALNPKKIKTPSLALVPRVM